MRVHFLFAQLWDSAWKVLRCPSVRVCCLWNTWLSLQDLDGGQPPQLIKWKVGETPCPSLRLGWMPCHGFCMSAEEGGDEEAKEKKNKEGKALCCVLSRCSRVWLCATSWTVARQLLCPWGFSRPEYWSGLPCPPPEDLPDSGIKPASRRPLALAGGFLTLASPGSPRKALKSP